MESTDATTELFGPVPFPRAGWWLLDTARRRRFTGELDLTTGDAAHGPTWQVFLDDGDVYVVDRADDAPLGDRLVAAGVLSVDELDAGTVRVGDAERLDALAARVPTRSASELLAALATMVDGAVAEIGPATIVSVVVRPYVRHPSGVWRWPGVGRVPLASDDGDRGARRSTAATTDDPFTVHWPTIGSAPGSTE